MCSINLKSAIFNDYRHLQAKHDLYEARVEAKHFELARWVLLATYQVIAEGRS